MKQRYETNPGKPDPATPHPFQKSFPKQDSATSHSIQKSFSRQERRCFVCGREGALPPEHRVPRMVRNNDIPGEQLLQHPTPMCEETGGNCPGNTQEDQEVDPFINMEVTSADLGGGVVTRQQARGKLLRPLKVPEVKGMETFQDVSINPELSPEKQDEVDRIQETGQKADSPVVDRTPCPGDPFVGDPQLMDIGGKSPYTRISFHRPQPNINSPFSTLKHSHLIHWLYFTTSGSRASSSTIQREARVVRPPLSPLLPLPPLLPSNGFRNHLWFNLPLLLRVTGRGLQVTTI
ncbi:hypothetical protein Pmani_015622 [Petrolisthes manimaculis]|uniref:Uncharacterized protein n=1 Tax=Petrolisthes manimaculis TaxID=1843537 RepID=A0AAE1PU32_9EUCA|nr:hypothetical protein Pmani_015622 [Petrolisthes manimaculis]